MTVLSITESAVHPQPARTRSRPLRSAATNNAVPEYGRPEGQDTQRECPEVAIQYEELLGKAAKWRLGNHHANQRKKEQRRKPSEACQKGLECFPIRGLLQARRDHYAPYSEERPTQERVQQMNCAYTSCWRRSRRKDIGRIHEVDNIGDPDEGQQGDPDPRQCLRRNQKNDGDGESETSEGRR